MKSKTNCIKQRGFTLLEMMIGFGMVTFVIMCVFAGISQFLVFSAQDRISQQMHDDLMLTMGKMFKDIQLSSNVIAKAGDVYTDNSNLVLRQSIVDATGEVVPDVFRYVTYSIRHGSNTLDKGLLRQVWDTENSTQPSERNYLNDGIVAMGLLFSGKPISQVTNLATARDIEIVLISGRETGLKLLNGTVEDTAQEELEQLDALLDLGIDFPDLREYIDEKNAERADVRIDSSLGSATLRNQRVYGLKTIIPPLEAPAGS